MHNYKAIADDYYINGLNNKAIFEKYGLERTKSTIGQERVYEHFPVYRYTGVSCAHCGGELTCSYVSKGGIVPAKRICEESTCIELEDTGLVLVEDWQVGGSLRNNSGAAYRVDGGHRVSVPSCILCGHELRERCTCVACTELKNSRVDRAAELAYKGFVDIELLAVEDLNVYEMLVVFRHVSEFTDKTNTSDPLSVFDKLDFNLKLMLVRLSLASPIQESVVSAVKMISTCKYSVACSDIGFKLNSDDDLVQFLADLKVSAIDRARNKVGAIGVLELWEFFAEDEAFGVLEHYCGVHNIYCVSDEKIRAVIIRSLSRYGLALTARYIYSAVWNARKYASEKGYDRYRAFSLIYRNMNFWIEDPRAREYNAPPLIRSEQVLIEPKKVTIFSRLFMEQIGVSYFSDPVAFDSLIKSEKLTSLE
jgi:hypothetical protein